MSIARGMTQTEARRKAKELGGIAVEAKWSDAKARWVTGGWASQPGRAWIVISLDWSTVLSDRADREGTE